MDTRLIVLVVIAAVAIILVVALLFRKRNSERFRSSISARNTIGL